MLRTLRDLTLRPGSTIRAYVAGQRRTYVNPFTYLFFASALFFALYYLSGGDDRMSEIWRQQLDAAGQGQMLAGAGIFQAFIAAQQTLVEHSLIIQILAAVPFAILLRLFFWRSGYLLAETAAFALFAFGQISLLALVSIPMMLFAPVEAFGVFAQVMIVVYGLFVAWAALDFFGRRISVAVRAAFAYWIAHVGTTVVALMCLMIYFAIAQARVGNFDEWTLIDAVEQDMPSVVTQLLQDGADPDAGRMMFPLHSATERGSEEIVALLIEHGADLDLRDHLGNTPLLVAVHHEHPRISRLLADAGSDPNVTRTDGVTLLMEAVEHEDYDLLRWLLEQGAEIDALRDHHQATALMKAVERDHVEAVDLLLDAGADPTITNPAGETAFDLADDPEILERLRATGAS